MSYSNGSARIDDLHQDGVGGLVLPVLLGLSVAVVTYLALFLVILSIAFAQFDYRHAFSTADALAIGVQGGLALGLVCALGSWLSGRRAQLRDVAPSLARRAGWATGAMVTGLVLLLGLAPALRLVTVPIYLLLAVAGSTAGTALSARGR